MTLLTFEETLKTLLMSPQGKQALKSRVALEAFLAESSLTKKEQTYLLSQSLERLQQYEYMLFANIQDTMEVVFPFTQQLIGDDWEDISQQFFWECPPDSYQLNQACEPFPDFLQNQAALTERYPFLAELALYEYVEAKILAAPNPVHPKYNYEDRLYPKTVEDLSNLIPQLNLTALFLQLKYPIPDIVDFLKSHPATDLPRELMEPNTKCMWIYRTRSPFVCRFYELTPTLAVWLTGVMNLHRQEEKQTYAETLTPLFEELHQTSAELTREFFDSQFLQILELLTNSQILLGSFVITAKKKPTAKTTPEM